VWPKPKREITPSTSTSRIGRSFAGIENRHASLARFLGLKAGALQSDDRGVLAEGAGLFNKGLKQT